MSCRWGWFARWLHMGAGFPRSKGPPGLTWGSPWPSGPVQALLYQCPSFLLPGALLPPWQTRPLAEVSAVSEGESLWPAWGNSLSCKDAWKTSI